MTMAGPLLKIVAGNEENKRFPRQVINDHNC